MPSRPCGSAARPPSDVLYADDALRARLLAILADPILPGTDPSQGRPGMDLWRILVMGVIKPGRDGDDDRRCELAGAPRTGRGSTPAPPPMGIRGTPAGVPSPGRVVAVGHEVSRSGRRTHAGRAVGRARPVLRGPSLSSSALTDVHVPTDVNLLWDALRVPGPPPSSGRTDRGRAATRHGRARLATGAPSFPLPEDSLPCLKTLFPP